MSSVDLSVVVIARNEEESIAKALAAVNKAIQAAVDKHIISSHEVIFVDSASTDNTVSIARKLPVKIVELPSDWPLSAAAGIYCGYREAKGTFVAVVDGDVEVDKHWFSDALPYLLTNDNVANVYGWWEESSQGSGRIFESMMKELDSLKNDEPEEVEFAGNGIFRKSALDMVGGHNPYLKGAEDKDISYRLRQAGFKLLQIPVQFGTHHWNFSVREYYRSVRAWSVGEGHAAAYARFQGNSGLFEMFKGNFPSSVLWRLIRQLILLVLIIGGALFGVFWSQLGWVIAGSAFLLISIQILVARQKDTLPFSEFLFHYFNRVPYLLYRHWYFSRGLKLPTPDPGNYPTF